MIKVKPKKHLGQHFLNDKKIAKTVTDLLDLDTRRVVELGPGMGVLTQFLIQKEIDLRLVEIDREAIKYLKFYYPKIKDQIIEGDFLKLNLRNLFGKKFSIIGNFPYNISSQILFTVLEYKENVSQIIGMLQKEVAERIVAKKGRKRGILSVLLQAYYDIEYCFTVETNCFHPLPKVKSGVIRLVRNNMEKLPCNEKIFKMVVKSSFNQRRKTLRNALKSFSLENKLIDPQLLQKRAEELSVNDYIRITRVCQIEQK